MALLDSEGRLQGVLGGKLHWLDALLLGGVLLTLTGVIAVKLGTHKTTPTAANEESVPVTVTIALDRVQSSHVDSVFTPGQELDLTIRNRPRGKVTLASFVVRRPKALVYSPGGKGYQWIPDVNRPDEANVIITVKDTASTSDDGYVAKGIKLKSGLHVTVEDENALYQGTLIDIEAIDTKAVDIHANSSK